MLTDIFRGRIVDVGPDEVMIEISGRENKVEAFIDRMRPFLNRLLKSPPPDITDRGWGGPLNMAPPRWLDSCPRPHRPRLSHLKAKGLEIIFVSSDKDTASCTAAYKTLPGAVSMSCVVFVVSDIC